MFASCSGAPAPISQIPYPYVFPCYENQKPAESDNRARKGKLTLGTWGKRIVNEVLTKASHESASTFQKRAKFEEKGKGKGTGTGRRKYTFSRPRD